MKRLLSLGIVLSVLMVVLAACSGPEEKRLKHFNKGKAFYEKGDLVKAELEFRKSIQIDRRFADAHYMLGMAELRMGNLEIARAAFADALNLNPKMPDAHIQMGNCYLAAHQPDEALKQAEAALKLSPKSEDALLLKAATLFSLEKTAEALSLLQGLRQRGEKRRAVFPAGQSPSP